MEYDCQSVNELRNSEHCFAVQDIGTKAYKSGCTTKPMRDGIFSEISLFFQWLSL